MEREGHRGKWKCNMLFKAHPTGDEKVFAFPFVPRISIIRWGGFDNLILAGDPVRPLFLHL